MKVIYKDQTKQHRNGSHCVATEYPLDDKEINGAVIELTGRYPETGRVVNVKCKLLAYVMKGSGKIVVDGQEININEGDMVFVEPGEKYFWDGALTLLMPCTPAWYPEQYQEVE